MDFKNTISKIIYDVIKDYKKVATYVSPNNYYSRLFYHFRGPVNPCNNYMETCCTIDQILQKQKPQPDPTKVNGCGYRNLEGFGRDFGVSNKDYFKKLSNEVKMETK